MNLELYSNKLKMNSLPSPKYKTKNGNKPKEDVKLILHN
jgi:hypothetical protein